MNRRLVSLALSSVLLCSMGIPALAADSGQPTAPAPGDAKTQASALPDSELYYGEIREILTGEDGAITGLHMDSEPFGEYVMKISEETFWIDSGNRAPGLPSDLSAGERVYVFHSPISTRSIPPQSAAFAVVRNVPQDTGCAMYHKVEAVEEQEGEIRITTDQGGLYLSAGPETGLSAYTGRPIQKLEEIKAGDRVMAWYEAMLLSYPGQAYARHIMVLDEQASSEALSRAALISLLHEAQGEPVVNYAMNYSDVDPSAPYGEAMRWAGSEGIISGYGDGRVGPGDAVNREQMAVMIWRWSGAPMLMDYPGLTSYSDAGDISLFAQPALAWAHQKGLLPAAGRLGPKDVVTLAEAEAVLAAMGTGPELAESGRN